MIWLEGVGPDVSGFPITEVDNVVNGIAFFYLTPEELEAYGRKTTIRLSVLISFVELLHVRSSLGK